MEDLDPADQLISLLEALPAAAAILDIDFRLVRANRRFASFSQATAPLNAAASLHVLSQDFAQGIEPLHSKAIETGMPAKGLIQGPLDSTGSVQELKCICSPLISSDGAVHGVLCTLEEDRDNALEQAIREPLLARIEKQNKELTTLLYVVSHDLRSPLVNIQGFGQELGRSCSDIRDLIGSLADRETAARIRTTLDTDVAEALQFIQSSAIKMESLLAGLLKLSRMSRATAKLAPLDMNDVLASAIIDLELSIQEVQPTLSIEDLPPCMGDEQQIRQLFTILVDNAIKYRAPNKRCEITISGLVEGTQSRYYIADNGVGIDRRSLERIFEPFYRANPKAADGSGVGLAIAQYIVQQHAGNIQVDSQPAQGSRFTVSLPAYVG